MSFSFDVIFGRKLICLDAGSKDYKECRGKVRFYNYGCFGKSIQIQFWSDDGDILAHGTISFKEFVELTALAKEADIL